MGMYTKVHFHAEVDEEAYEVFAAVKAGFEPEGDHPFFQLPRMSSVFGHDGSYYFPGACHLTVEADRAFTGPIYSVSLLANLKNYEGEIEEFFDWVTPHVKAGSGIRELIGYSIYEEGEEPTLYYAQEKG